MHIFIQSLINELKTAPTDEILKFAAEEPETAALIAEVIKVDIKRKTDIIDLLTSEESDQNSKVEQVAKQFVGIRGVLDVSSEEGHLLQGINLANTSMINALYIQNRVVIVPISNLKQAIKHINKIENLPVCDIKYKIMGDYVAFYAN